MSDRVLGFALFCLALIACFALWVDPAAGKEIAIGAVGAIGGSLATRAGIGPAVKGEGG